MPRFTANVLTSYITFVCTLCLESIHPTLPLSVHYALNLCYCAQKPAPFTLCSERARRPVCIVFSRTLILLLLCSSGDVEVNPGPAVPSSTPTP
jgi:hypothetical protein